MLANDRFRDLSGNAAKNLQRMQKKYCVSNMLKQQCREVRDLILEHVVPAAVRMNDRYVRRAAA